MVQQNNQTNQAALIEVVEWLEQAVSNVSDARNKTYTRLTRLRRLPQEQRRIGTASFEYGEWGLVLAAISFYYARGCHNSLPGGPEVLGSQFRDKSDEFHKGGFYTAAAYFHGAAAAMDKIAKQHGIEARL
ncbi:hypothetical protein HYV82_03960 [Candidatus Woesearchaeota archaeon]|nr:hypothetical protein [Candidatus Woesearchaeota archaeon]